MFVELSVLASLQPTPHFHSRSTLLMFHEVRSTSDVIDPYQLPSYPVSLCQSYIGWATSANPSIKYVKLGLKIQRIEEEFKILRIQETWIRKLKPFVFNYVQLCTSPQTHLLYLFVKLQSWKKNKSNNLCVLLSSNLQAETLLKPAKVFEDNEQWIMKCRPLKVLIVYKRRHFLGMW